MNGNGNGNGSGNNLIGLERARQLLRTPHPVAVSPPTARSLALEGCSPQIRALAIEIAASSEVPDDDPLWLVFLASADRNLALEEFNKRLEVLEKSYDVLSSIESQFSGLGHLNLNPRFDAIDHQLQQLRRRRPNLVSGILVGLMAIAAVTIGYHLGTSTATASPPATQVQSQIPVPADSSSKPRLKPASPNN